MITMTEIRQLVRIINMRFVNGCTSETLDTIENRKTDPYSIPGFYVLRGLDLYKNGTEAGMVRTGSRSILRASTRHELYYKLSAFIDGAEEADRAQRVLTGK